MKIGLVDIDSKIPNLALMKLSSFHKGLGDTTELTSPLFASGFDKVYASKVFSWDDPPVLPDGSELGGYGWDMGSSLPEEVEHTVPDYDLYGMNRSMGFTTRGCVRKCSFCAVSKTEGDIRPHTEIDEFVRHRDVILMDNNIIAHPHGIEQLEKLAKGRHRVDILQGVDVRLVDRSIAKVLGKSLFINPLRLACDSDGVVPAFKKAVTLLREENVTPKRYSAYVMVKELESGLRRIEELKSIDVDPFVQPFRDREGTPIPSDLKRLARWANHKAIYKTVKWEDYN